MKRNAKIEFGGNFQSPSCFAYTSWSINKFGTSDELNVLKVFSSSRSHYLSVISSGGGSSSSPPILRIHSKLGAALGLKENEIVTVSEITAPITQIQSANVSCVSSDDWEILESNTDSVINGLLHQIRVIYPGQKFPFWITKSLQINLQIASILPQTDFGVLSANSVIIVPSFTSVSDLTNIQPLTKNHFRLRVHPLSIPDSFLSTFPTSSLLLKNTRNSFVFHNSFSDISQNNSSPYFFAQLLLPDSRVIFLKLFLLERCEISGDLLKYFSVTNPPSIYLHPELIKDFDIQVKSHILIKITESHEEEEEGKILLLGVSSESFAEKEMRIFPQIIEECQNFIKSSLSLGGNHSHNFKGPNNGCLLIEGGIGSGKSILCKNLGKSVEGPPFYVHWEKVSCGKWKGKKAENVEKELKTILERCQKMCPSLLFFDDLDVLTSQTQQQENLQENFAQLKMCETIRECLMNYCWDQQFVIVATARSKESLNPYWKSRQGFHLFHKIISIPSLTQVERISVFEECLDQYKIPSPKEEINLILKNIHEQHASPRFVSNIAKKWASHILQDKNDVKILEDLVQKEIHFFKMESSGKKMVKDNLKINWNDVAGLKGIKEELIKILEWPIKYKNLFKNSPIRLPSGILFYGYPGTGKTLLGLSIPSLVNTQFIHVKGPELLSKYIGASEQAVQDVFKRARSCSPCVLFFDEFDSLVPRRGHDSTGVTDRVVNQFLAEMDGIEGGLGQGVYLIAATSRPDLIDPAVLRPGRLDKHFFFDLPNFQERKEILEKFLPECKPEENFIKKLNGLTGADIQSLICSAQLTALQRYLENPDISSVNSQDLTSSDIGLNIEDLTKALETLRPSLHGEELNRFVKIYQDFCGNVGVVISGKRATLA